MPIGSILFIIGGVVVLALVIALDWDTFVDLVKGTHEHPGKKTRAHSANPRHPGRPNTGHH